MTNKEVESYSQKAVFKKGVFNAVLLKLLESRLDNVVFRLGLANSRRIARQLVNHGHIKVNGRSVNIASYQAKKGDLISLKEKSSGLTIFKDLESKYKKYETPSWLTLDKNKKEGQVAGSPEIEDGELTADLTKIKEFFSR